MPADAAVSSLEQTLAELERRAASFEQTAQRIQDKVRSRPSAQTGNRVMAEAQPGVPGLHSSGFRPAGQSPTPNTGALTPHARSAGSVPGFTSVFGKPAVALVPADPTVARPVQRNRRPWWKQWQWQVIAGLAILAMLVMSLPRRYPVLPDAGVWADALTVEAARDGSVDLVPVRVGDEVKTGQILTRIAGASLVSPIDGVVARLLVSVGTQVKAGEIVAEIAVPASRRVVVALPGNLTPNIGDLVRIELLGDRRTIDGNIEQVLLAGVSGSWISTGASPRRAIIQPAPSLVPISLRQGARVTIIGSTPLARLGFAIRDLLPW